MHPCAMFSRVRHHFKGSKLARMSNGTYCIIRDLGLVKGGKGMRHHEVLVTFSLTAVWRSIGLVRGDVRTVKDGRSAWPHHVPSHLTASVRSSAMPENVSQP